MFYFIKGLSVFRIVTEPCADRFLLLGGLSAALHHALDVGGFGGREDFCMYIKSNPLQVVDLQRINFAICGERGIRTPGGVTLNGFQDRRNRPLCHLSWQPNSYGFAPLPLFCDAKLQFFFLTCKLFSIFASQSICKSHKYNSNSICLRYDFFPHCHHIRGAANQPIAALFSIFPDSTI